MQAHSLEVFILAKIVFYPKKFYYPLLLPSHNCIIINSLCSVFKVHVLSFQETQWSFNSLKLQSISWGRIAGSNRWPPACKAGALPAELNPHIISLFCRRGGPKWWTYFQLDYTRFCSCNLPDTQLTILPQLFFEKWWAKMDSNHRPHDYQSCALASWAIGPYRLLTS